MELKNMSDVKPDPKNPRRISKHDYEALKKSIIKFGDLSCVVFNVRTQQLVAGHQRWQAFNDFPGQKRLVIETRLNQPNKQGTVAEGKLWYDNESYKYREVDWDLATQRAANIAPNRIMGEFDLEALAEINHMLLQETNASELLEATGQTEEEIDQLLAMSGVGDDSNQEPEEPSMTLRIKCESDKQMTELYEELKGRGLNVSI